MDSTSTISRLQELAKLQDNINSNIDSNWKEIRTLQDWVRPIWTEAAELMGSLPWPWWKKLPLDINNITVELVDILHFTLSYLIELEYREGDNLLPYFAEELDRKTISKNYSEEERATKLILTNEQMARQFLNHKPKIGLRHLSELIKETAGFEKIYKMYIGKNILNHLRQNYGYKQGTYNKIVNGREDNEYLMDWINEGLEIEEIKLKLEEFLAANNTRV